jgi:hypothetical protein
MRVIAYAAIMCTLLAGAARAEDAQSTADILGGIYVAYQWADLCYHHGFAFKDDDVAKLAAAIKDYAQRSGLSQEDRDEQWELAKKGIVGVAVANPEECNRTRTELAKTFPGLLPKISDNPF